MTNNNQLCTPNEVLSYGFGLVEFLGLSTDFLFNEEDGAPLNRCVEWFTHVFGPDHVATSAIWFELQEKGLVDTKKDKTCLQHLLVALFFVKSFKSAVWNERALVKNKKHIRKWVRFYIPKIAELRTQKDDIIDRTLVCALNGRLFVTYSLGDEMAAELASKYRILSHKGMFRSDIWRTVGFRAVLAVCQYQIESLNAAPAA